ncbi:MAG: DUF4124 domain-containing protein [Burkholderiaceae bacterium]
MSRLVFALALASVATVTQAQNSIWLCVDEAGRKTFTNSAQGKGCSPVDVQPVANIPAPRAQPRKAPTESAAPANYPRVESATQKARDTDRKRILEDELRIEEDRLVRAQSDLAEADKRADAARSQRLRDELARAQANVASLRREISLLARQ